MSEVVTASLGTDEIFSYFAKPEGIERQALRHKQLPAAPIYPDHPSQCAPSSLRRWSCSFCVTTNGSVCRVCSVVELTCP